MSSDTLDQIEYDALRCMACPLHASRTQPVLMRGSTGPSIVFIGEAPGFDEDRLGRPFVGAAGHHLDQAIKTIFEFSEEDYAVINVIKCRPPNNRRPTAQEIDACSNFLARQLAILCPDYVILLGSSALNALFSGSITALNGTMVGDLHGIPVFALLHPSVVNYGRQAADFWRGASSISQQLRDAGFYGAVKETKQLSLDGWGGE